MRKLYKIFELETLKKHLILKINNDEIIKEHNNAIQWFNDRTINFHGILLLRM